METIMVPAPPKSAFNKNRPVSDLILHQLQHFQHVVEKHGMKIDPALERDLATEGGAARYIATVTREMRAQAAGQTRGQTRGPRLVPRPAGGALPAPTVAKPAAAGLDLAAATESSKPATQKKATSTGRKPKKPSGGKGGGKRKR